ncbi:hypothetical protein K457DRAFT_209891 [Linnemannia elongata AG-77]|uniref:Uncharacterized protein n=1 Tax=Linnemannia elongata AG-77 TaxID=1314771 RepID=A0A197JEK1_9FUNG|nr:hypothetical protein K457DRAFT_209891 [Linnemannia elongata AG-77]
MMHSRTPPSCHILPFTSLMETFILFMSSLYFFSSLTHAEKSALFSSHNTTTTTLGIIKSETRH